jgi:hypothetical protein
MVGRMICTGLVFFGDECIAVRGNCGTRSHASVAWEVAMKARARKRDRVFNMAAAPSERDAPVPNDSRVLIADRNGTRSAPPMGGH